jgi:hypothetical protein
VRLPALGTRLTGFLDPGLRTSFPLSTLGRLCDLIVSSQRRLFRGRHSLITTRYSAVQTLGDAHNSTALRHPYQDRSFPTNLPSAHQSIPSVPWSPTIGSSSSDEALGLGIFHMPLVRPFGFSLRSPAGFPAAQTYHGVPTRALKPPFGATMRTPFAASRPPTGVAAFRVIVTPSTLTLSCDSPRTVVDAAPLTLVAALGSDPRTFTTFPFAFGCIRVCLPGVSSAKRYFIPCGFNPPSTADRASASTVVLWRTSSHHLPFGLAICLSPSEHRHVT